MRCILAATLILAAAVSAASAQQQFGKNLPSCEAAPPAPACDCRQPQGCPRCQPPCEGPPREGPPREGPPRQEYIPQEVGAYVAAPRAGTMRGATRYRGLDFGAITIPEFRLRLPSIELPGCFRGHTSARMMVDSSVAQWESQGFVNAAAGANEAALRGQIDQLQKELDQRGGDTRAAQDRAAAERSACEEYTQKLRQYEDQLRRINEERKALEQCIRQCLDDHNRAAVIPPAEMGCVDPRTGAPPSKEPLPPQPTPPAENGARRLAPLPQYPARYVEQPAAYISEAARLPPQRHWITEPRPAGRITGVRPVGP